MQADSRLARRRLVAAVSATIAIACAAGLVLPERAAQACPRTSSTAVYAPEPRVAKATGAAGANCRPLLADLPRFARS